MDLTFTRLAPVSARRIWRCWTEPALLTRWFTPVPWRTVEAEVDLRPGGIFRSEMRGPAGEEVSNVGCWLEVVPHSRLTWTDALLPGFRPSGKPFVTATLTFEERAEGTRYTARALHANAEDCARHEAMGFEAGWGMAFDQMVAVAAELPD